MKPTKAKRQKLETLIDQFLAERRKSDGGYPEVTDDDIGQLYGIIELLADLKAERDCDNDQVIEFLIYSRREHEPLHYAPVPYSHVRGSLAPNPKAFNDHLSVVSMNYSIACTAMNLALRILQYDYDFVPKKKEKS